MSTQNHSAAQPCCWKAVSDEPVRFCLRICLDNGVTLLYDDLRGLAEGSDGRIYYAVCQETPGPDEKVKILGWSAEISSEIILQ